VTADEYLHAILRREAVDTGILSPVRGVQGDIEPIVRQWAGTKFVSLSPSGSFAKGTANKSGTDIDLFISLAHDTQETLREIYHSLFRRMTQRGYPPKHQNVSMKVKVGGYSVDLVPAKRQGAYGDDHSLFRRKADTWTKTNVTTHITVVRQAGRIYESRIQLGIFRLSWCHRRILPLFSRHRAALPGPRPRTGSATPAPRHPIPRPAW